MKDWSIKIIHRIRDIYYLAYWFYNYIRNIRFREDIPRIENKLIIIGNGPSTSEFDFFNHKLKGYDFLCVNLFASQNPDFFKIKPRYYCIIDDAYYRENRLQNKEYGKLFEALKRVNWQMIMITLSDHKIGLDNSYIRQVRLNRNTYYGDIFKYILFRKNLATRGYQNVINAAIYFAVTAKAKEVYLIGVENDWHRELNVNNNNEVIRITSHFYGNQILNLTEIGEIKKGELYKYFYWYYTTLYKYYEYALYAKALNVPVYNLTKNSFIDVFDRKDL